jgi:predicted esterase
MTWRRPVLVAFGMLGLLGCSKSSAKQSRPTVQVQPRVAATAASSALPPLDAPWMVRLSDGRSNEDVVTVPQGATEPRPVIVAVHGAGDRPEWACGGWRIGVESYAFVVCPAGLKMSASRYGWGSSRDIDTAVERALSAARQRFGQHMAPGPMIYAAFSQGAILARPYLIANAKRFPVIALAEGGYDYLGDSEFARQAHDAGVRRVLLLCGTPGCATTMKRAARVLERAQLEVLVGGDVASGHNLNTPMQNALRSTFAAVTAGLPNWDGFASHRWPPAPSRHR